MPLNSPARIKTTTPDLLDESTGLLKAFADPVRLRLLSLLAGGEVCVCHLQGALELPQPTVSRHPAYLRKRGVGVARKEGLWVHYRLAKARIGLHRALILCLTTCFDRSATLEQDRERLARIARPCS